MTMTGGEPDRSPIVSVGPDAGIGLKGRDQGNRPGRRPKSER